MSDYYGDYYGENIYTGNKQNNQEININNTKLKLYINSGLSSVKIAKKFNCSYTHILKYVKNNLPEYRDLLKDNGRKNMIRKPNDKAS